MELKYRRVKAEGVLTIKSVITLTEEEVAGIRRIMDHEFLDPEEYRPEGRDDFDKLVSFSHWIKEMSFFAMLWENKDKSSIQSIITESIKRKQSKRPSNPRRKRK